MTKPSILTFFHEFRHELIHKDVGAIPFHLAACQGWQATVAFFGSEEEFRSHDAEVWRRSVELMPLGPRKGMISNAWRVIRMFARNGRRFSVFNYYHDSHLMVLYALVYKIFNRNGKVYCKLDIGHLGLEQINRETAGRIDWTVRLRKMLSPYVVDIYSVETEEIFDQLKKNPYFANRIIWIPNGFSCPDIHINNIIEKKQNIILTVGNLGSYAKNNEMFLEALAALPPELLKGWKVMLVGPNVNPDYYEAGPKYSNYFHDYIRNYLEKHSHLKDVITSVGRVDDRRQLYDIYAKAKIFCLTSRYEGFPHVVLESMYFGCFLFATDLPACREVTDNGRIGCLVPSEDSEFLAASLKSAIDGHLNMAEAALSGHRRVRDRYAWQDITELLSMALQRRGAIKE